MYSRKVSITFCVLLILLLSACGSAATPAATEPSPEPTATSAPVEPSVTPLPPTDTPVPPTDTPEPSPTTAATAKPTSVPGTKFEFTSGGLTYELKVPECDLLMVMYGTFTTEGAGSDYRSKFDISERILRPDSPADLPRCLETT